ncbi:HNH endonuclease [Deinococcus hopiensis]|uniref:HNH endonuclease n=1 Tax=Deinococcus hopiensis KR-140 TaxID=695939 RepID=A0A1W1UK25_9DEIO|nr:HNH endonuclease signature motif containing protein [Deinococcus hopiensis]SMB81389.1 hypothetical protein SAMN00790413_04561 [Deinococcus hopiensis KR-140]
MTEGQALLARLLRHEAKTNSYKFALIRALNDLALEYPLEVVEDVAVPLRRVAERWLVFYWGFVGDSPVYQGARAQRDGTVRQDVSFRAELTGLREAWEALPYTRPDAAGGALLLAAYRAGREQLPPDLQVQTAQTLTAISRAVRQPVRYAGGGDQHRIFGPPAPAATLSGTLLPGTQPHGTAFLVPASLWRTLQDTSLWVEALCVHEWSLFVERASRDSPVSRGDVFARLSASPESRTPLTWERHQVRLLMLKGQPFACPWTGRRLVPEAFDLDHIIPVSVHPIQELWNLVPSDPAHNMHVKRARIPEQARFSEAAPRLTEIYAAYGRWPATRPVLAVDVAHRFGQALSPAVLTQAVTQLSEAVAQSRNVPRY